MRSILFFTYNGWAFGKIHNELIKALYPEYYCDIWCWTQNMSHDTATLLLQKYDVIMTTPAGAHNLHTSFGVPYNRIICLVHLYWDLLEVIPSGKMGAQDFESLLGYAVLNHALIDISIAYGIARVPEILPIGVMTQNYARPMPQELRRIGYFAKPVRRTVSLASLAADGEFHNQTAEHGIDIKRGYLAQRVAELTGLELVMRDDVHVLVSDRLYQAVDMVMFCSLSEGLPTTALEAMAAGLPVLGTNTGIFAQLARSGGGGVLPFAEEDFVNEAVEVIQALQADPELFQRMCAAAKSEGLKHDWAVVKPIWLDYFQSLEYTG